MIELHYAPTPNGWKITIMLEEIGLAYKIIPINLGAGDQFKPEFLAISPNNRMPAIIDNDGPQGVKVSVFESGAILMYLAEKSGKFLSKKKRKKVLDSSLTQRCARLGFNSTAVALHFVITLQSREE